MWSGFGKFMLELYLQQPNKEDTVFFSLHTHVYNLSYVHSCACKQVALLFRCIIHLYQQVFKSEDV